MKHEYERSEGIFGKSPTGWLLNLLFFPSGIISLALILLLLKRSDFTKAEDDQEAKIKKAGRLSIQSDRELRPLRQDEIHKMISEHMLARGKQRELEKSGDIEAETCGYCMGSGRGLTYVELPCGHYHHASCMKSALEQDLDTCADCGFRMKTLVL